MEPGDLDFIGYWPKIFKVPPKVEPFVARTSDMFDIMRLLKDGTKVINVFGFPGLGKSSIVRNVTNYVAERSLFPDGVLYLNLY